MIVWEQSWRCRNLPKLYNLPEILFLLSNCSTWQLHLPAVGLLAVSIVTTHRGFSYLPLQQIESSLSQKQFLGTKYFTILHENIRDIALKMYGLCILRYIITNSYTYIEAFHGSFFAKVSRDILRY